MSLKELGWLRAQTENQNTNELFVTSGTTATPPLETDVLIIGAVPAGTSVADFLARDGISTLMISSASSTAKELRVRFTNLATMDSPVNDDREQAYGKDGIREDGSVLVRPDLLVTWRSKALVLEGFAGEKLH
jgi:hypothetical protein